MDTILKKTKQKKNTNAALLLTIITIFFFIGFKSNFKRDFAEAKSSFYFSELGSRNDIKAKVSNSINYQWQKKGTVLTPQKRSNYNSNSFISKLKAGTQFNSIVDKNVPTLPDGMVMVTPNFEAYKISGITNTKESKIISIPYNQALIPIGYQIGDIRTYRFDENFKKWEELQKEGIDPEKNLLYSRTHADGLMINGIIKSPELPQTDNYTPTRINDLKLADPGSNVQLIEPPSANQQGSARLSYNIEIPRGRNGIEPELKITYSSDGGNGLLGEGWDLHFPTIAVETRWGVPTYDPTNESETYLLDGEMLAFENNNETVLAHRNPNGIVRARDRIFFKRKQTDFHTIIRHGDSPKNYWWEIIDNKGTKFFYGKTMECQTGCSAGQRKQYSLKDLPNSVLKDANANIAEWKLTRVEDVFGNVYVYNYPAQPQKTIAAINIINTYPNEIQYSGWEKDNDTHQYPYNYKIEIKYTENPKVNYSARYGFFTGNLKLVDEIIVSLNHTNDNSPFSSDPSVADRIRSYKFTYNNNNTFNKSLLTKLTQFGTDGITEFYHHDFEYYDDVKDKGFFSPTPWTSQSESLQDGVIPNSILPNTEPTDLGGSKSSGNGLSFYAGLGVNDWQICNRNVTVGIQFGFNNSQSKGLNTLIDIDGDGLPDKVYVIGDSILFRKNTGTGFSSESHVIGGRNQFFEESSSTNSFGVSAYFGASVSRDNSSTTSDITTYFSDVNADGLVDIVSDGRVYFNHIDDNGIPSFSDSSNGTPQPITGGKINVTDPTDYPKKRKELALQNPQHDVVRVWEAPLTGVVDINAPVSLTDPNPTLPKDIKKYDNADGITFTIQKGGSEIARHSILKSDYTVQPISLKNILVTVGEKIYFRVMSGNDDLSNGDFDKVNWTPEIVYTSDNGTTIDPTKNRYDVFGENLYEYSSGSDFLYTNEAGITPDGDRTVKITMPFKKEVTSDDIKIQIVQISENRSEPVIIDGVHVEENGKKLYKFTSEKVLFNKQLGKESISTSICSGDAIDLPFSKESIYQFRIVSDVNTNFKKVTWEPTIYFKNASGANDTIFVIPNYQLKSELLQRSAVHPYPESKVPNAANPTFVLSDIHPYLKFRTESIATDDIWFTIRKGKSIVGKYNLKYKNGKLIDYTPDQIELNKGEELYATFESNQAFKNKGEIVEANWVIGKYASFDAKIDNISSTYSSFTAVDKGTYILTHHLAFKAAETQSVRYSILRGGTILKRGKLEFNNQQEQDEPVTDTIQLNANDIITVNYENITPPVAIPPTTATAIIEIAEIQVDKVLPADLWYKREDDKFGPMFRNWGQFAYNDKKDGTIKVINESVLKKMTISDSRSTEIRNNIDNQLNAANTNPPDISTLSELNKKNAIFNTLIPFRTVNEYLWKGMDDNIFINQLLQSSSRVGLKDVLVESPFKTTTISSGTASGIVKRTSSKNVSTNVSMVLGASISSGTSKVQSDYLDLNGDRFPDIIGPSDAQLTLPNGTLGSSSMSSIQHNSGNKSLGMQIGGSTFTSISSNTVINSKVNASPSNNMSQNSSVADASSNQATSGFGGPSAPTIGSDWTNDTWLDVNGDGLPDKFHNNGLVEFNLGKLFSAPINISGLSPISKGSNYSISPGGFGFNNGNSSISGGLGISISRSLPEEMLQDINGDGLVDRIKLTDDDAIFFVNDGSSFKEIKVGIQLNQGSAISNLPVIGSVINKWNTSFNASAGNSFGGNFTFGFVFGPIVPIFKAVFSPGATKTKGLGTTLRQFFDINGDGYPDYLYSEKEGDLQVKLSNIGRTNKLKSVSRPLGGSFEIDYTHNEAKYDHPNGKWVMNTLTIKDGVAEDRLVDNGFDAKQSFVYKNGKYDRYNREFLGFGEITTKDENFDEQPIRKHIQIFDNKNYYTANNLISDRIEDANGNKYLETVNEYWHYPNAVGDKAKQGDNNPKIDEFDSRVYSCPLRYSVNNAYEGKTQKVILNESYFEYDELGNNTLFRYSNKATLLSSNFKTFDYETLKRYQPKNSSGIFGLITDYSVHDNNRIFRQGKAKYNGNGTLEAETAKLNSLEEAKTQFIYDAFGNIVKKILPDGFSTTFEYESKIQTYIQKITNQRGDYSSNTDYDYRFGFAKLLIDTNGNSLKYALDPHFGRIKKVWSPMEFKVVPEAAYNSLLPTIEIFYDSDLSKLAHSKVVHKTILDALEEITTHTYIDGNKRIIQTKKNAVISNTQGNEDSANKWIASGKITYDAIGRIVRQAYPCKDTKERYDNSLIPSVATPSEFSYDVLDRKTTSKLPLSQTLFMLNEYGIDSNQLCKSETVYNENSAIDKVTTEYYNGSGGKVKTVQKHLAGFYTTTFEYDAIHQLTMVKDNKGNPSTYDYDYKGRIVKQTSSDGGARQFNYDLVGNKINEILPNSKSITYAYDHERLTDIVYPDNPQNNVQYVYGNDNGGNRNGKLYYKQDATGAEEYTYDQLGNITQVKKTVIAPFDKSYTFETKFSYDSWNRIRNITYPDGDLIEYKYNSAGMLNQITGTAGNDYVDNIGYDEFEQRSFIKYGNDVTTSYAYDDRRRLNSLALSFAEGKSSQCIYSYDNQNNISIYGNRSNIWSGDLSYTYKYNDLSQLIEANGSIGTNKYRVTYEYDDRFNLLENKKSLTSTTTKLSNVENLKYDISQTSNHIDKITETTSRISSNTGLDKHYTENNQLTFGYDNGGNIVLQSKEDLITKRAGIMKRAIIYDEEDRISAVNLNGFVSNYFYSDNGDRIIKLSSQTDNVYVNGQLSADKINSASFSLYVSPYFSTRNGGSLFTKHIYIGNERIISELANPKNPNAAQCDNTISSNCNAVPQINYNTKKDVLDKYINDVYNQFDLHHKPIASNAFATPLPLNYHLERNPSTTQPTKPIDIQIGLRYFYHTNQINSVNYISDSAGKVVQQIEYLPYGQVFMEKREGYASQFTFSGQEEDRESGLSYFGARYYDPFASLWLSVDPMANKYPGLSPYNYCLGNPITMIDPDGNDAMLIVWKDYPAGGIPFTGHAGALLINNKSGATNYYEYGRYDPKEHGIVRTYGTPNITFGKNGMPTEKSLNKVLSIITSNSGTKNGIKYSAEAAYFKSKEFNNMKNYSLNRLNENSNSAREEYSKLFNNCGDFATEILKQDESIRSNSPWIEAPNPYRLINQYKEKSDYNLIYNPKEGIKFMDK